MRRERKPAAPKPQAQPLSSLVSDAQRDAWRRFVQSPLVQGVRADLKKLADSPLGQELKGKRLPDLEFCAGRISRNGSRQSAASTKPGKAAEWRERS